MGKYSWIYDSVNTETEVGDTVAAFLPNTEETRQLFEGKIIRINKKSVSIEYVADDGRSYLATSVPPRYFICTLKAGHGVVAKGEYEELEKKASLVESLQRSNRELAAIAFTEEN